MKIDELGHTESFQYARVPEYVGDWIDYRANFDETVACAH